MPTSFAIFETQPYQGYVRDIFIAQARQNSSFLNDREKTHRDNEMLFADLKATVEFCDQNVGRAVSCKIIDESRRIFGDKVNLW
jgi:hypothetical protein